MPDRRHPNVVAAAEIEGRQLGKDEVAVRAGDYATFPTGYYDGEDTN